MTIRQWYSVLMEDRVLMSPATENNPQLFLPVRAEILSQNTDWSNSWKLSRIKGVESKLSAFLFKLLHRLLATQDRVQDLGEKMEYALYVMLIQRTSIGASGNFFHFFLSSYLLLVTTVIQNHRRGCRRVSKFCMGT